jgi:hypothetical protein
MPEVPEAAITHYTRQTLIWTALPQGREGTTLRLSAFITPQLSFLGGNRRAPTTTTKLSTFKDWVNWPATIGGVHTSFKVSFNGGTPVEASWDPKLLNGNLWTAIFDPTTTRVDSFAAEDFSKVAISTFGASAVHRFVTDLYGGFNAMNAAGAPLVLTRNTTHPTKPHAATGPAAATYKQIVTPPSAIANALSFHERALPKHGAAPTQPAPQILDFHSAVASLGSFPELLRTFGLAIPLQVTVPANLASATSFTVAVIPTFTTALSDTINVSLPTASTLTSTQFLATPHGSDYQDGMLDLGNGNEANSRFSIVDVDVDGASQGLNAANRSIASIVEANSSATSLTLNYTLPILRSSGPSLLWDDWGGKGNTAAGQTHNLNTLATRQAKISAGVAAWIADHHKALPTVHAEDISRGWRIDVLNTGDANPNWKSLHWRLASYSLGTGGAFTLSADDARPYEGMVVPGVTHEPIAQGALPSSVSVHESIARWDGWSLSAPRPGGQINDDGTSSPTASGNPMPSTTHTDGDGNINPQISAEFFVAPAGTTVDDPLTGTPVGTTGLPTLRFGSTYQYRARAVDLSGWSVPQNTTTANSRISLPTTHYRWEPIQAPYVVPTAPLTAGEGALTVVLRDDGVAPATANSRWLFPPKVHQKMAEEQGAFDDSSGSPDPAKYATIAAFNDGSLTSITGIQSSASNLTLAVSDNPTPVVTWLPDPAGVGIALYGLSQDFPTAPIIPSGTPINNPNQSPTYLDLWEPARGGAWPALLGKLLTVEPVAATAGQNIPRSIVWSVTSASADRAENLTLGVTPGSVYALRLSSILDVNHISAFGQWYWIVQNLTQHGNTKFEPNVYGSALEGLAYQLTPYHTLRVVYAVLLPQIAPAFSALTAFAGPRFIRSANDTTVEIQDANFAVDGPTTASVTFTATWTDPVDDTKNAHPDTDTVDVAQGSLVATVVTVYDPPVDSDPMLPTRPTPASPFGTIASPSDVLTTEVTGQLAATHRIGDTKHHLITYAPTATSRFGQFFATTGSQTFTDNSPVTFDDRGIDVNLVSVVLPATATANAVTLPASLYSIDAPAGQLHLVGADPQVKQGGATVHLFGRPLDVTYVPTDTVVGASSEFHIPSSAAPPPLKVVKVVPAWSTVSQEFNAGTSLTRTGNILRVYLERPWYVTGANELVGVVAAVAQDVTITPKQALNISPDQVSAMGFDPISAPGQTSSSPFTQNQLSFITNADVPAFGSSLAGGNPVIGLPGPYDATGEWNALWAYQPYFDQVSDQWYVDVQLDVTAFPTPLPAGYFLQLSLVRFQPYSANSYVSPVSLVTFAQPVADRSVAVTTISANESTTMLNVTVSGPSYLGWRPVPDANPAATLNDRANRYAPHPNSDGKGTKSTSTMIVEVQAFDATNEFGGDFAWSTIPGSIHRLTPGFTDAPNIEWTSPVGGIAVPLNTQQHRLRISELDYYPYADDGLPATIGTAQRRSFVAHISA